MYRHTGLRLTAFLPRQWQIASQQQCAVKYTLHRRSVPTLDFGALAARPITPLRSQSERGGSIRKRQHTPHDTGPCWRSRIRR